MRQEYPDDKIGIITIFPSGATRALLNAVLKDRWKIKTVQGYIDPGNKLFEAYEIMGVPFSVLFDANGKEAAVFAGFPGRDAIEEKFKSVIGK